MRIFALMLLSICWGQQEDRSLQKGEDTNVALPVRIFAPDFFENMRGATIYSIRARKSGGTSGDQTELCNISDKETASRLVSRLARLTGYRVPPGLRPGKWRL